MAFHEERWHRSAFSSKEESLREKKLKFMKSWEKRGVPTDGCYSLVPRLTLIVEAIDSLS